jgi:hypothetical protein
MRLLVEGSEIELELRWHVVPGRRATQAQRVEGDIFERLLGRPSCPFQAEVECFG